MGLMNSPLMSMRSRLSRMSNLSSMSPGRMLTQAAEDRPDSPMAGILSVANAGVDMAKKTGLLSAPTGQAGQPAKPDGPPNAPPPTMQASNAVVAPEDYFQAMLRRYQGGGQV